MPGSAGRARLLRRRPRAPAGLCAPGLRPPGPPGQAGCGRARREPSEGGGALRRGGPAQPCAPPCWPPPPLPSPAAAARASASARGAAPPLPEVARGPRFTGKVGGDFFFFFLKERREGPRRKASLRWKGPREARAEAREGPRSSPRRSLMSPATGSPGSRRGGSAVHLAARSARQAQAQDQWPRLPPPRTRTPESPLDTASRHAPRPEGNSLAAASSPA